jgi:DNA repair exonuclease SbcCD ATPase subunit
LRDILENAQTGSQANADLRKMKETLDNLSQIISKQQRLLDETYRAHQKEQPQPNTYGGGHDDYLGDGNRWMPDEYSQIPEQQQGNGQSAEAEKKRAQKYSELEERQKALQQHLSDFQNKLKGLGGPPMKNFNGAGQDMKKAEGALGQQNGSRASEQQTRALEKLRKGAKSLAEKMMSGNGGGSRGMGRNGRDPLGRQRPGQGLSSGDTVKVPEEGDLLRAREILEELRRRLGERTRSADELDYIERLIQQY